MSWFGNIIKKILKVEESSIDLNEMTKKQLEEYGRTLGVELDRRHSKKKLIAKLESL